MAPEVAADLRVRSLLALAAGRRGDAARARRLLRGVDDAHTADVFVALAEAALRSGDEPAADGLIEETRSHSPAHPELPRLTQLRLVQRAERRRPQEDELAREAHDQPPEQRAALARAFLARWPESAAARQLLHQAEDRLRHERVRTLLDAAEGALGRGDVGESRRLWDAAIALGGERPTLGARLDTAEAEQRRRLEQEAMASVLWRLCDPAARDRPAALLAWLALDSGPRAQVRERAGLPLLAWLERVAVVGVRSEAAVDAVLALERALTLSDGDPEQVLALLAPHEKALRPLPEARKATEAARNRIAASRHAAALRQLDHARAALERRELVDARRWLEGCDLLGLTPLERDSAQTMKTALETAEHLHALEARFEAAVSRGDLLASREAAAALGTHAHTDVSRRAHWSAQAREADAQLHAAWHITLFDEPGIPPLRGNWFHGDGLALQLTDDGTELVLFEARAHWLFVQRIEVDSGRLRAALLLRTPEPLDPLSASWLDGDTAVVAGSAGRILRLGWRDGRILSWQSVQQLLGEQLQRVIPIPGTTWLWLETGDDGPWNVSVVDGERWTLARRFPDAGCLRPVLGAGEPRIVVTRNDEQTATLFNIRGTPLGRLPVETRLSDAAIHPSGRGLVVLDARYPDVPEPDEPIPQLILAALDASTPLRQALEIAGSYEELIHCLATSLDGGLTYCSYGLAEGGWAIDAYSANERGFERVYSVPCASWVTLAGNRASRRVVLARQTDDGLELVPLGPDPPQLSARPEPASGLLPKLGPPFVCDIRSEATPQEDQLDNQLRALDEAAGRAWVQDFQQRHAADPQALVALHGVLRRHHAFAPEGRQIARLLRERHATEPSACMIIAGLYAEEGDWEAVLRTAARQDRDAVPAAQLGHLLHLLGAARLRRGDIAGAVEAWSEGRLQDSSQRCQLGACLEAADAIRNPGLGGLADAPAHVALIEAVLNADAALARNDAAAALRAVDRGMVWRMLETQSLARLAEAHLRLDAASPGAWLQKAFALATLCHARAGYFRTRDELVIPHATWDAARLDALGQRCAEWLDTTPPPGSAGHDGSTEFR